MARYPAQSRGLCEAGLMHLTEFTAFEGGLRRHRKSVGLPLTRLLNHLDEYFSGLRRIVHFPQERDPSSLHVTLGLQPQVKAKTIDRGQPGVLRLNAGILFRAALPVPSPSTASAVKTLATPQQRSHMCKIDQTGTCRKAILIVRYFVGNSART